jgi:hypothetical protein
MAADSTPPNTNLTGGTPAANTPEFPSAFSLFKPSWEGLKQNLVELIVIFLVPTLLASLLLVVGSSAANDSGGSGGTILLVLGALVAIVYAALIGPAIIHIQLKSSLMEKATYESAWETSKKFWWRFILLSIAIGIVVLIGFILFIIPGIILLKRYFLAHYALIDQDLGVGDSMRKSNELSKNRSMTVYGVLGVDILINIPSAIPVVGSVITFALQIAYFCAPAIRYQELKAKPAARPVTPNA